MTLEELWNKGDTLYEAGEYKEAFACFKEASEKGLIKAMYDLGYMYYSGEGTEKSHKEAKFWLEKAAVNGMVKAQYKLGVLYEQSDEFKDFSAAAAWYEEAAKANDRFALCNLGILYYIGLGVDKDKEKAMALLKESAEQGYERASDMLTSIMYKEEAKK